MNPEEYLKQTRAAKPGPFLRQSVLNEAERAWRAAPSRRGVRRVVFHPFAAAASVVFALGVAWLSSEIDSRATASLVGHTYPNETAEQANGFADTRKGYEGYAGLWDEELADALAWRGSGAGAARGSRD